LTLHPWLYFFFCSHSQTKGGTPYELEIILTGKRKEHEGLFGLNGDLNFTFEADGKKKWMKE
jgi:hypothetical protein